MRVQGGRAALPHSSGASTLSTKSLNDRNDCSLPSYTMMLPRSMRMLQPTCPQHAPSSLLLLLLVLLLVQGRAGARGTPCASKGALQ